MESKEFIDLGLVSNLAVIKKPGTTEKLLFVGQSAQNERWVRIITHGAAQALWFHLTAILYPRAAEQITPRAATAVLRQPDAPTITTTFVVHHDEDNKVIRVRGIGGQPGWMIRFSTEEGYELWASLEDVLDAV
jgi:hypothetical protein